ncbi:unnamed protein product, partial [Owenia fusiformis]
VNMAPKSGNLDSFINSVELSRLASYTKWPTWANARPGQLAEAGLQYTGKDDKVRCFFCGGELCNWEVGEVPWQKHLKFFPECGYLKDVKGTDWVKEEIRKINDEECKFQNAKEVDVPQCIGTHGDTLVGAVGDSQWALQNDNKQAIELPASLRTALAFYGLNDFTIYDTHTKPEFQFMHVEHLDITQPALELQPSVHAQSNLPLDQGHGRDIIEGGHDNSISIRGQMVTVPEMNNNF